MRALKQTILARPQRQTVLSQDTAGTYTVTLAAGRYVVTLVGAGAGASSAGYMGGTNQSEAYGTWIYGCGGGGAAFVGTFHLDESAEATVTVGAKSSGSMYNAVVFEPPSTSLGYETSSGGDTSFSCGTLGAVAGGGGGVTALVPYAGTPVATVGGGGTVGTVTEGFDDLIKLQGGAGESALTNFITVISIPTDSYIQGGLAGIANGTSGAGGKVNFLANPGSGAIFGLDGNDGFALIERII